MYVYVKVYERWFEDRDLPGAGFAFTCDADGTIHTPEYPEGRESLRACLAGEGNVIDRGIRTYERRRRVCNCGSGESPWMLTDARGIPCGYVCRKCQAAARKRYRPEVFTDSQYECDEAIDPE